MSTFNRTTLTNDILAQLGNANLEVELDTNAFNAIFNRTLEVFNKFKPLIRREVYETVSGVNIHPMPSDVTGVVEVQLLFGYSQLPMSGNIESLLAAGVPIYLGTGDTTMDVQYLDLRKRWLKQIARTLGTDPDYEVVIDPDTNIWTLWTYSPAGMKVDAKTTIDHKDDLTTIPHFNRNWVSRWALTEAQKIVGNVRGKYVEIPVADGKMRLNGPALIASAEAEQKKLMDELISSLADVYPRWS